MLTIGIILIIVMGVLTVTSISTGFSLIEKIGLSFPVGMGIQTILMALINLFGARLTATNILATCICCIILLCILLYLRRKEIISNLHFPQYDFSGYNFVWLLFMVLIIYFEYMNFVKCMYFPTFDRDSLAGFDTIGYVIAQEHTFKGMSLFQSDYMPQIHNAGSYIVYAPMVQLSYAFVYILGAETSKLIPALMYLFFLPAFYGCMKRVAGRTGASVATFFMMITPEMISFSSLSATNVIHAVSASLGVIYVSIWFRFREKKDLYTGSLLLGLNIWTRTDGVVFILAALFVVFIDAVRRKAWSNLLPVCASFLPALFWVVFIRVSHFEAEGMAITHLFWDAEKAGTIWESMKSHYANTEMYGWGFAAFLLSLLANSWYLIRKRDNLFLLTMMLVAAVLYMVSLYQINYTWDTIQNVLAYSAKRFLFCFIPLAWFCAMSNMWMTNTLSRLEKFLQ